MQSWDIKDTRLLLKIRSDAIHQLRNMSSGFSSSPIFPVTFAEVTFLPSNESNHWIVVKHAELFYTLVQAYKLISQTDDVSQTPQYTQLLKENLVDKLLRLGQVMDASLTVIYV